MKIMKKISALVIAMVMVLAMALPAMAEGYSVIINKDETDKAGHTYAAYQIFTGDLHEETVGETTTKTLSNIVWGSNVDQEKVAAFISELDAIDGLNVATGSTAAQIAEAISKADFDDDSVGAQAIADAINKIVTGTPAGTGNVAADGSSATITGLAAGYYFMKDLNDVDGNGAETRFILEVVSDVTTKEKASVPTITKKVQDKNDSVSTDPQTVGEGDAATTWQDSADYDIGDSIAYQITGTLPSTFGEYDTYKTYTITDTLSAGLTAPKKEDVIIKVGDTDVTSHFDIVVTGEATAEQVMTITLKTGEDLRTWNAPALTKDSKFVVSYNAVLNDAAVIAGAGNPNTVKLDFSNNPNYDSDGDYGTTPTDTVIVFTYKTVVNKVDGKQNPLAGAEFTLYKVASDYTLSNLKVDEKALTANTAMTPAAVTAIMTQLEAVKKNTVAYTYTLSKTGEVDNKFTFKGIDDGRYVLVESKTPDGYNTMLPLIFDVKASHKAEDDAPGASTLTDLNGNKITGEINTQDLTKDTANEDALTQNVVNNSGATLPSTGGIGTTIFYVIGGVLVVLAGIVLVTRRKSAE